ncbi:MAG TPA: hypothetical protein VHZ33_08175 [Trebonia sp.]|nr:hypothetical protein [Trebonia sp.]
MTINRLRATRSARTSMREETWRQKGSKMGKGDPRTAFTWAVAAFIGYNALVSVIGLIAKLPDVVASGAKTDSISIGQVLYGNGTIMSPPLLAMVAAALLLWGARGHRFLIACACTAVLTLVTAVASLDEVEGFSPRPAIFTAAKWDFAIALGSIFAVIGIAVVVSGIWYLSRSIRLTLRSRDRGRPAQAAPRSDVHT